MPDLKNVATIEDLLELKGIELFLNSAYEPSVRIPEDVGRQDWPVNSERFRDLVDTLLNETSKENKLRDVDRRDLLSRVREACRKGRLRLSQSESPKTDEDLIVQAVVAVACDCEEFNDRTAVLLRKCKELQQTFRLPLWPELPRVTNIFSRKLKQLTTVLGGYGIAVDIQHKEDGSYCILRRLPHFQWEPDADTVTPRGTYGVDSQPSAASSALSPNRGKELRTDDDDDGASRFDEPNAALFLDMKPKSESSDSGNGQAVDVNETQE